jgi:hypothetical protein
VLACGGSLYKEGWYGKWWFVRVDDTEGQARTRLAWLMCGGCTSVTE